MNIPSDLANFYNSEAKKYHQTRKKHRSDAEKILSSLEHIEAKSPKILELGCGWGRGISLLQSQFQKKFSYTWVDLSEKLLELAKKDNPNQQFVCANMEQYVQNLKQESLDAILAFASFQHLSDEKSRLALMKNAYRALNYGGIVIFTNWSISKRFLKTHWKVFLISAFKSFFSLGKRNWRDVFIPWKTKSWTHYRYYHLFWLNELKKLTERAGFLVEELCFLDKKWNPTKNWKTANNSFLVARKIVNKEEFKLKAPQTLA